jgi:hypothetical protein
MAAPATPSVTQPQAEAAYGRFVDEIVSNAHKELKEERDTLQAILLSQQDELTKLRELIAKHQPLIDTVAAFEGSDDKEGIRFVYEETDAVVISVYLEICRMLGESYNIPSFQVKSADQRIANLLKAAINFVIRDATDLFIAHAQNGHY